MRMCCRTHKRIFLRESRTRARKVRRFRPTEEGRVTGARKEVESLWTESFSFSDTADDFYSSFARFCHAVPATIWTRPGSPERTFVLYSSSADRLFWSQWP